VRWWVSEVSSCRQKVKLISRSPAVQSSDGELHPADSFQHQPASDLLLINLSGLINDFCPLGSNQPAPTCGTQCYSPGTTGWPEVRSFLRTVSRADRWRPGRQSERQSQKSERSTVHQWSPGSDCQGLRSRGNLLLCILTSHPQLIEWCLFTFLINVCSLTHQTQKSVLENKNSFYWLLEEISDLQSVIILLISSLIS